MDTGVLDRDLSATMGSRRLKALKHREKDYIVEVMALFVARGNSDTLAEGWCRGCHSNSYNKIMICTFGHSTKLRTSVL